MNALFFLSMTSFSVATAVVFYRFGRRDLVSGEKNEEMIRGTFCHIVAVSVFFLFESALCLFADITHCPDLAGILTTCGLLLVDLIPLLYLRDVRYSPIGSPHVKWIAAFVLFLIIAVPIFGFTKFSRAASYALDCVFIIYSLTYLVIVLMAQCRLTCRFGKENMSDHLFRSTGVISFFLLNIIVFTVCLMFGKNRTSVTIFGETVCMVIACLHSLSVLRNYPVLVRMERRWRKIARLADMEGSNPDILLATERLSHRLTDYFEVEKPYLSPDLCITEVAMYLMTNKTTLSRAINGGMKCSFRELVNRYRVREAMNLYMRNLHLDMEQLARLSGFRNNTSFTNAFKINVGKTPGVWCKEYKEMRNEILQTENSESIGFHNTPKKGAGETEESVFREDSNYK